MLGSQVMGQSQSASFQCWASIPDKTNPLFAFAWWASAHNGYIVAPATSGLAYMCQTFNSAGGEPTLIYELKNMQFQLGLNIFSNFKSRVVGRGVRGFSRL